MQGSNFKVQGEGARRNRWHCFGGAGSKDLTLIAWGKLTFDLKGRTPRPHKTKSLAP